MKKFTFSLALAALMGSGPAFAQHQYLLWLKDKGPEAQQYRQHPAQLLSQKALEKRQLRQIPLSETDFPVSNAYLVQLQQAGAQVLQKSKWLNAVLVETQLTAEQLRQELPAIARIQEVGNRQPKAGITAGKAASSVSSSGNYGAAEQQLRQLNLLCLHQRGFRGTGVLVACFDTGFQGVGVNAAFDSLRNENRLVATRNFNTNTSAVFSTDSHGAWVFSTMAALLPGTYIGGAPKASFALAITEYLPTETHQEEMKWAAAAEWADSIGADIIQSSLTYHYFDPGQGDYTTADLDGQTAIITRAAVAATRKGMLVVNSAGNNGTLPAPMNRISPPADADSILAVGAATLTGNKAAISSIGPTADNRIKPDISALGQNAAYVNTNGNVGTNTGTSLSAPLISALAACLWQAHPAATNMQIRQAVLQSASRSGNPDNLLGYGIPDACKADSLLTLMTGTKEQLPRGSSFHVSPTLTSGEVTIWPAADGAALQLVEIISATGAVVERRQVSRQSGPVLLTLASHSAGMYLVRLLSTDGRLQTCKVVKQ